MNKKPTNLLTWHLRNKVVNVLVTNRCNLSCGGCSQMCGLFPKREHWNIPIEQLKFNIDVLCHPCRKDRKKAPIGIFGGEPTIHPQWEEIVELLRSYNPHRFIVFTNGILPKMIIPRRNLNYVIDRKVKGQSQSFRATTVAACDKFACGNYWKLAQEQCYHWGSCFSIIYDNRAYACEIGAAFDRAICGKDKWHESKGWKLELGKDPFNKTDQQMARQQSNFCFRCGHCTGFSLIQDRRDRFYISRTNRPIFDRKAVKANEDIKEH